MRVVPSDVIRQIERIFPNVKFDAANKLTFFTGHKYIDDAQPAPRCKNKKLLIP